MEKINKFYVIAGLVIAFGLLFGVITYADELDQKTTVTFSAPIEIPGKALPAGTYVFKLADSNSDRNLVEIFDSAGTKLYATVETVPTERWEPAADPAVTLAEQGSGKPDALLTWFYPGCLTGHEFRYSAREEKQLAQARQQTIVVNSKATNSAVQAGD
jgi:hypothetical protein